MRTVKAGLRLSDVKRHLPNGRHINVLAAALSPVLLHVACSSGFQTAAPTDMPPAISVSSGVVSEIPAEAFTTLDVNTQETGRRIWHDANARVERVIDGDTITVRFLDPDGDRRPETVVRLESIDTPEKTGSPRGPECYGDKASNHMKGLLERGAELYVQWEPDKPFDRYGRLLAFVYLPDEKVSVNHHLVERGYAEAVDYGSGGKHTEVLLEVGKAAQRQGRGMWGACFSSPL